MVGVDRAGTAGIGIVGVPERCPVVVEAHGDLVRAAPQAATEGHVGGIAGLGLVVADFGIARADNHSRAGAVDIGLGIAPVADAVDVVQLAAHHGVAGGRRGRQR